ncbi:MAG TPA: alanine--tRNA ligase [Candidatus Paceibacterota bacterium]|jgi:alanyl-tRNA synthetase|nr:alanine--tRNA ligase [Candidatus Paceibacterota bacterium]
MESNEIRKRFLKFFEKRGHKIIPSASLVPENDPSVLFNTAGMQPLVPYLLGQEHPMGKRLVNVQKCVRTQDIDEVGDNTHDTFFEMMGNWSLGDYFKKEAIPWSYEFLTSKEEGLGLDPQRLYVTCFEGDKNSPKDTESAEIWEEIFKKNNVTGERIYFRPADKNWWSVGDDGPCGPDTEMFYDLTGELDKGMTLNEYIKADEAQKVVEVWNDVFMQYEKKDGKVIGKLKKQNVDTGAGLERVVMAVQGKDNIFDTDLFEEMMIYINNISSSGDLRAKRIVADHIRTSVFMIGDGVLPSNTARGYILRRLLRRAIRFSDVLGMKNFPLSELAKIVMEKYADVYSEFAFKHSNRVVIDEQINAEEVKFRKTLEQGMKILNERIISTNVAGLESKEIPASVVFDLFQSYGFPVELTEEVGLEKGITFNKAMVESLIEKHKKLSQTASAGMFKGGLANHNEKTVKLHTAHHLLLAGLQAVVDKNIKQRGSNITEERLRIDFLCGHKLTDEEKKNVEEWVNDKIAKGFNVVRREMPIEEAHKIGAEMEFGAKYTDIVSVYFIEDKDGNVISKEFCGGPHIANTGELGTFKIQKEQSVAEGIRRIKATLVV